jgi:hypothetical protein
MPTLADSRLLCNSTGGAWGSNQWSIAISSTGYLNIYVNNMGGSPVQSSSPIAANAWYHIAIVRNGSTFTWYINGISSGSGTNASAIDAGTTNILTVGYANVSGDPSFTGYISNLRMTKGGALYTGSFTPSTTPLTTTVSSGTVSVLTCQSNRFVDNSANAFALTTNSTPSVQAFGPFAPALQWTPDVVGGSGYFDGTGDYLSIANSSTFNIGTGNFTVEAWVYCTSSNVNQAIFNKTNGTGYGIISISTNPSGLLQCYSSTNGTSWNNFTLIDSVAFTLNQWVHVAAVRNGTTVTLYKNGVSVASTTNSTSLNDSNNISVGLQGSTYLTGYISNTRFVIGTAVYTAAFTPPTAPLTAITNTSLLLNCTNAGIYDGKMANVLETVGSAQVSTNPVKYGSGSINIPTSSGLFSISKPIYAMPGDYTIEFWVYHTTAITAEQHYITFDTVGSYFFCGVNTTGVFMGRRGTLIDLQSSVIPATNTWNHIAFTRANSTTRIYVNGISVASAVLTTSYGAANLLVSNDSGYYFVGYMDDIRITNGVARYIANFTPPQQALPRQ